MSDIVERLRKSSANIKSLSWEAADEIERLRERNASLEAALEEIRVCVAHYTARLEDKLSDHKPEKTACIQSGDMTYGRQAELKAEIERLQAAWYWAAPHLAAYAVHYPNQDYIAAFERHSRALQAK